MPFKGGKHIRSVSSHGRKFSWQKLFGTSAASPQPVVTCRVLYVHIPKAGGSAVNDYFSRRLGLENCAIHAEGLLRDPSADLSTVSQKQFISAHLTLPRLLEQINQPDRFVMTVLRNPLEQTVSHLAWMRYQAEKSQEAAFSKLPEYVQELVGKLAETDLSDPEGLDALLASLCPRERSFFDNCQTRYLTRQLNDPVNESQLAQAIQGLQAFNLVGLAEYMQDLFDCLSWRLGLPGADGARRVNVSRTKFGLDASNPAIGEVLEPYIRFDRQLYAEAKLHFFSSMFRFWQDVEKSGVDFINRKTLARAMSDRAARSVQVTGEKAR